MQGHGRCFKLFLAFSLLLLKYAQGGEVDHSQRDTNVTGSCIEKERHALLAFKRGLVDDYNLLSSWGSEAQKQDCCRWVGVSCSNQTGHVLQLDLSCEVIGEDYYLQDFSMNSISGSIPKCLTNLIALAQKENPSLNISHVYKISTDQHSFTGADYEDDS
ncbi:PREDICTED: uncharacterized protein LOC107881151, partial [Prunus mume]|uniref:Uncharacterized protein LOC107881151 n=1 Tax=Prunus mume TaxID=102107 RepID=A0ABM1LQS1_PRUMU